MINFDKLPTESPNTLPEPNVYLAEVVFTEMKQPQDESKPMYLNMRYQLTDGKGKNAGSVYDMMFDSEANLLQYKLGRFIQACGIPLQGQMELKDLAKLVMGKKFAVDIKIDEDTTGKYPDKAVVDVFSREVFYPQEQFKEIYELVNQEEPTLSALNDGGSFVEVPDNASADIPFDTSY